MAYAWGNFGERGDPLEWNTKEGMEMIEQGEVVDRPYADRQASPGDVEAVEGMGAISDHEKEVFVPGDRGVGMYRNRVRKYCLDLANKGIEPPQPTALTLDSIHTYGSDSVVYRPEPTDSPDSDLLRQTNDQVMSIIFGNDHLTGEARDNEIIDAIDALNQD